MSLGIIAEYNPFHNGHAYHIARSMELASSRDAVVVMSGDFVQRGEPAMFSKRLRAKWALEHGASMVISLPAPFSLACAELFAMAGVMIIAGTGLVDRLCFGSETADLELLRRAAKIASEEPEHIQLAIREGLKGGLSHPRARAAAYSRYHPELSPLLSGPNDMLGMEYIKAIDKCAPHIQPLAVPRRGPVHDSPEILRGFASASTVRHMVDSGEFSLTKEFLPAGVYGDMLRELDERTAPITMNNLSREIMYALRSMDKSALSSLPDVSEGLDNLLYAKCREQTNIDGLLSSLKSRRYTLARLKRICICALLGIHMDQRDLLEGLYIRVLGVRRDSMHLIGELCRNADLPVILKHEDVKKLNDKQLLLHKMDMRAAEISPLGLANPGPARWDYSLPLLTV